jgi:hypothetical protein
VAKSDMPEFHTSFEVNRVEHPHGCAFELSLVHDSLTSLLRQGCEALRQRDKEVFFDHVLAYRPTMPKIPLFSFHDAFNGGTLTLSGIYSEDTASLFSSKIAGSIRSLVNPYFSNQFDPP